MFRTYCAAVFMIAVGVVVLAGLYVFYLGSWVVDVLLALAMEDDYEC